MKKLTFLFLIGISSLLSQTAVFPNAVVTDQQLGVAANGVTGLLNNSVQVSDTSLNIKNGSCTANGISTTCNVAYKVNMFVTIDSEIMRICSLGSATGVTVLNLGSVTVGSSCPSISGRGLDGTQIAAHSTITANACNSTGTGCVRNNIIAWNNNAKNKEIEAIEAKNRDIISYGADPTGVADSLAAFNAAYAASNTVIVPAGTFRLSGPFNINRLTSSLICDPASSKIIYTGTSDIDSVIYAAIPGATIGTAVIEGCRVFGNSHVTGALIHVHSGSGNSVRNVILGANSLSAPAACLWFDNGNTNQAIRTICAGVYNISPATGVNPASIGIILQDEVEAYVTQFKLEGIPNEGLKIIHSGGVSCSKSTIESGTTEGNGTGISVSTGCAGNLFNGVDIESNSVVDVVDAGQGNIYLNVLANFHFTSTSNTGTLINSSTNNILIDAGAQKTFLLNSNYGNTGGSLTDNGTCTNILNLLNINGGNFLPNILGCQSGMTVNGSFNRVLENATSGTCPGNGNTCPASANNAIAGTYNSTSASGGYTYPVSCPAALNQTNDGMLFFIRLTHTLQAGTNTFNFCGFGALTIVKASNLSGTTAARIVGSVIQLRWSWVDNVFVDLAQ